MPLLYVQFNGPYLLSTREGSFLPGCWARRAPFRRSRSLTPPNCLEGSRSSVAPVFKRGNRLGGGLRASHASRVHATSRAGGPITPYTFTTGLAGQVDSRHTLPNAKSVLVDVPHDQDFSQTLADFVVRPILQRIGGRVAWSFYPVALLPVRKLGSHCAPALILTVLASKHLWNPLVEANQLGSGGVKEELRRYWSELKYSFSGCPERGRELRVVFVSLWEGTFCA